MTFSPWKAGRWVFSDVEDVEGEGCNALMLEGTSMTVVDERPSDALFCKAGVM